ncbi:MAG: DNA mismatch repair protein MutS [Actinobacteria bacterium]|nr:DNA mismatch repair protein MutS [Actinomycetota bacterium]
MEGATPMIQQYRSVKAKHQDAILFFRLGDFYEMFFEDAELASRELEITLTGRDGGKALGRVPMCGIPYHSADSYIAKLIEKGYKVAICEQLEDPSLAKGIVRREVIRIITPGTLVEPRMLDERRNNYLAAICGGKTGFGLASADISTGEFAVTQIEGAGALEKVFEELSRLSPAECLLEPALEGLPELDSFLRKRLGTTVTVFQGGAFTRDQAHRKLTGHFGTVSLRGYGCEDLPLAIGAAGALLAYLEETQKTTLGHITGLATYFPGEYMVLDQAARRNLELTHRLGDGSRKGTLLSVLDRTVTSMGARMLRSWIERPLYNLGSIRARLDAVDTLVANALLRAEVRDLLKTVYDLERLAGRAAYGTANAKDLVALGVSLSVVPQLRELIQKELCGALSSIAAALDPLESVRDLVRAAVADDPPFVLNEGGLIRSGYSPEVDQLREVGREGKKWIARLEAQEKERTGIKSLKVGFNKVFGYYIEITNSNLTSVPADYTRKQTLANAERFITPELKEKESLVLGAEEKLVALEYQIFSGIRQEVAGQVERIQKTARALAELDALAALADVAVAYGYCKPTLDEGDVIRIEEARHPVLERSLAGEFFVPNDVLLDCDEHRLVIVTGPNMGGKSTYMRSCALIVLMAQAGSFVPARTAQIGLVDRIFTRVGASDDLATGQSTFMVEMNEVGNILHNATRRSLVILDEIGRGTSTFDGLSIAWAVAEYIHDAGQIGAKALFATHYHELTELEELLPGVVNLSVAVKERGDDIVFLRKVVRGGADRSYGIQVARLAGLPPEVIRRAREILLTLENHETGGKSRRQAAPAREKAVAGGQVVRGPDPVLEELRNLNVLTLTPVEALNTLYQLQEKAKKNAR